MSSGKDYGYTWHLSLRVDRPVEGCNLRPHAYMYSKKLDERDIDKPMPLYSKRAPHQPAQHEFHFRWFRGPMQEPCAYSGCPRRTSFSPHDWSSYALGGGCSLQCVSTQSSLFKANFCNSNCFVQAWKTQYTIRRPSPVDEEIDIDSPNDDCRADSSSPTLMHSYQSYNDFGASVEDTEEWVEVSQDAVFTTSAEDVGRKIKVECTAVGMDGEVLLRRAVKTDLVLARAPDPIKRNLVTMKGTGNGNGTRFRVVTYNILAEIYATQQMYPYCDFWALSWDYRFQNILRELKEVAPDVMCLQEVQADHYETHLYQALNDAGFEGVYKQKTRASMGISGKVDGCAIFWKKSKFHLVESYSIEFNELAQRQCQVLGMNPRSEEGAAYLNRLSRDNVAQLIVLEFAQPSSSRNSARDQNQVCIANTHLYSNKDFPDVKLWQTWQLLQELETFVLSRNLPLMICGDFNSTPDTAVYDLLSRSTVHPGHPDVNMNEEVSVLPDVRSLVHSFQLGSVYNTVMREEPEHTNFTVGFKGVLDYMWFSAQHLRPLSAAPIPNESVLTKHGEALPSTQFSSDHIMLISDMQLGGTRT